MNLIRRIIGVCNVILGITLAVTTYYTSELPLITVVKINTLAVIAVILGIWGYDHS